jgi:putative FmdB family regulatory protein
VPIYEFYCRRCNTIYNFYSRVINTDKVPRCPSCKTVRLKRQMSVFAKISRGKDDIAGDDVMPQLDDAKMEKAIAMLASEAEAINEDNPRQTAGLMRKLSEVTGMKLGPGMEEALNRLEKGEDPEKIEEDMGALLEGEEPFVLPSKKGKAGKAPRPRIDETLYDL